MILLIDNYDSFTFNLYQMLGSIEPDLKVIRNDANTAEEILAMHPAGIVLSPGPGRPKDAGVCEEVIRTLRGKIPILGVCLGEQAISEDYWAEVTYAKKLMHGKTSSTSIDTSSELFHGLPDVIETARYHSLAADSDTIPEELTIIARSEDGEVMGVEDRNRHVYGVQFHPESIMTPQGSVILENFIRIAKEEAAHG